MNGRTLQLRPCRVLTSRGLMTWGEFGSALLMVQTIQRKATTWSHWSNSGRTGCGLQLFGVAICSHYEIAMPAEKITRTEASDPTMGGAGSALPLATFALTLATTGWRMQGPVITGRCGSILRLGRFSASPHRRDPRQFEPQSCCYSRGVWTVEIAGNPLCVRPSALLSPMRPPIPPRPLTAEQPVAERDVFADYTCLPQPHASLARPPRRDQQPSPIKPPKPPPR